MLPPENRDPAEARNGPMYHPRGHMKIALAALVALSLSACASPRDDGAGKLWIGVKEVMNK